MESDQNDFNPPAIERVALRLLCRTAVMMRGHAEGLFQQGDDYAQELYSGLAAWAEEDIVDELCESEKTAIFTPLGEMDQQAFLDASWACENVVCLAWALTRMPLPRYDALLVLDDLAGPIGLQMTLEEALTGSELRSFEEIEAAAMTYETVYWRVRDKNLEENSSSHSYQKKLMRRATSASEEKPALTQIRKRCTRLSRFVKRDSRHSTGWPVKSRIGMTSRRTPR